MSGAMMMALMNSVPQGPVTPVTGNLRLYYNPNDPASYPGTGSTVFDLSSSSINGTLSNVSYTAPYFTFNGTSSEITVPDNALLEPTTGDWTWEAWFNTTAFKTGSAGIILGKFPNGGAQVSYAIRTNDTGLVYCQIGSGIGSLNSTTYQTQLDTWVQVVYVWTNVASNSFQTYINGASIGSVSHSYSSIVNSTTNLYIGSYNGGEFAQYFDGKIGVIRMYNTALTSSQVLQNYNATKGIYGL